MTLETPPATSERRRPGTRLPLAILAILLPVALAGCGGGSSSTAAANRTATTLNDQSAAASASAADQSAKASAAAQSLADESAAAQASAAVQSASDQAAAAAQASAAAAAQAAAQASAAAQAAAAAAAAAAQASAQAAAAKAAAGGLIHGTITVPDLTGAIVTQVGGYPGEPLGDFTLAQLNTLQAMTTALGTGTTYPCPAGSGGGFVDIAVGGQVVVTDGNGSVLATSTLTGGVLNTQGCTFSYSAQVPGADFYSITVTHRGALTYSKAQMIASGWRVAGSL